MYYKRLVIALKTINGILKIETSDTIDDFRNALASGVNLKSLNGFLTTAFLYLFSYYLLRKRLTVCFNA